MYKKFVIKKNHSITAFYSFFEMRYDSNYRTDGEIHDFWEIVCVIDGTLGVTAGKDVYILESGQAIIHKPMEFHNLWSEKSCPLIIIFTFDGDIPNLNRQIFKMSESTINTIISLSKESRKIFEFSRPNDISISNIKEGKESQAEQFLKKCEIFIISLFNESASVFMQSEDISAKNYMKIASFLNDNIDKQLCIYDIAKALNMSESNVKKVFKKYSGVGIIHYFNTMKMQKAQHLLKTGMSIKEVSENVGFLDQNYFSIAFKRIVGMCPKEYKNSN